MPKVSHPFNKRSDSRLRLDRRSWMRALAQEGTGDKVESSKKRSMATRDSNASSADPRRVPDSGGASTSRHTAFSPDPGSPRYDGRLFFLEEEAARLNPSTPYSESPHQQETEIAEAADSDSYSLPDDSELQRKLPFGKCFLFQDCIRHAMSDCKYHHCKYHCQMFYDDCPSATHRILPPPPLEPRQCPTYGGCPNYVSNFCKDGQCAMHCREAGELCDVYAKGVWPCPWDSDSLFHPLFPLDAQGGLFTMNPQSWQEDDASPHGYDYDNYYPNGSPHDYNYDDYLPNGFINGILPYPYDHLGCPGDSLCLLSNNEAGKISDANPHQQTECSSPLPDPSPSTSSIASLTSNAVTLPSSSSLESIPVDTSPPLST